MAAIAWHPSPNHERRRGTDTPDTIVLHYTGMPSGEAALAWLCDPSSGVSAHYQVFRDGRIVAMVPEARRAWHAGESAWQGARDLNSRSIGVEIENEGHDFAYPDYTDVQIDALIALLADIRGRWSIPDVRILAHSDIAPHRKRDPGEKFPWARLAAAGHGLWPDPAQVARRKDAMAAPPEPAAILARLAAYGYDIRPTGEPARDGAFAVAAFQRRFRPSRVDGRVDIETAAVLGVLEALAAAGERATLSGASGR